MTRDEVAQAVSTAELLPVMEAWLQGKQIQLRSSSGPFSEWSDFNGESPGFEEQVLEWRIKPVPRRWWLIDNPDGTVFKETSPPSVRPKGSVVTEVVEVLR